jgi:hypothetical protein
LLVAGEAAAERRLSLLDGRRRDDADERSEGESELHDEICGFGIGCLKIFERWLVRYERKDLLLFR